jgi:hypothetical protein
MTSPFRRREVVDELVNLRVGEVGGFDQVRDAAFGDEVEDAGGLRADGLGVESGRGPAVAEDDVGAVGGSAAEGCPVAEQVAQ